MIQRFTSFPVVLGALWLSGGLLLGSTAARAADNQIWQDVAEAQVARSGGERQIIPSHYRTLRMDLNQFASHMAKVPSESRVQANKSDVIFTLPMPDGSNARFSVVNSPIFAPELAAKYPQIQTWLGQGIDDPSATLRFDITPKGFHAQVLSATGTTYIDPYQQDDREHYISYFKQDHQGDEKPRCGVTGEDIEDESIAEHLQHSEIQLTSGANLRTYRLAIAATGEYTAFHGGTVVDGLSAVATMMNRVNGIYEREVSVRMQLVANNDQLIYTDAATDPYTNTSSDLNSITSKISAVIGNDNYDVGHLVGTGGGGVAGLGVICTSSKGRGLTGSPSPVGDAFDVDYVAHEIGHQFGGGHTFNGSGGNCSGGNRMAASAYEPGSAVSIQGYAGICGDDDLQYNSEDFFHRISLNQIIAHSTTGSGGNCGVLTSTGNQIPQVSTAAQFTIPANTPFELVANALDDDGDALTYAWEQFDLGAANTAGSLVDNGTRPLFRAFAPSSSPTRIFPSLRYILDNANVPPATAPLIGTTAPNFFTGELLPTQTRDLNFRVTVRDNRAGGGGTNEASTLLKVNAGAGPFRVTAPNTAVSLSAGSSTTMTWDVANTSSAPVNASQVDILLSLDGGYSWPVTLASSVANTGSATVTIPAGTVSTSKARVKIKAVGNVFFDISDVNFTITGSNAAPVISLTGSVATRQGSPVVTQVVGTVSDVETTASALTLTVDDAPSDLVVIPSNTNGNVAVSVAAACTLVAPSSGSRAHPVRLRVTDGDGASSLASFNVMLSANQAPAMGTYAGGVSALGVTTDFALSSAISDVNLSSVTLTPSTLSGATLAVADNGTVSVTPTSLAAGTYTVRVTAIDSCDALESRDLTFTVPASGVDLQVSDFSIPTGNQVLEPGECNELVLSLTNAGADTATAVSATLSTLSSGVNVTQAISSFPDIPSGQTRELNVPFEVSTDSGLACFSDVPFRLTLNYTQSSTPVTRDFTMQAGQPVGNVYSYARTEGASLPAVEGTRVTGSNADDAVVTFALPFNVSYYGVTYPASSVVSASTNGSLQMVSSGGQEAYGNSALPSASVASPAILPFWDDLVLTGTNNGIYTLTEGAAPNRRFYVIWRGYAYSTTSGTTVEVAVVFSENTENIEFIYSKVGAGAALNGASATIGLQGPTNDLYTEFSFNQANSVIVGTKLVWSRGPEAICSVGAGCGGVEPLPTEIFSDGFESD